MVNWLIEGELIDWWWIDWLMVNWLVDELMDWWWIDGLMDRLISSGAMQESWDAGPVAAVPGYPDWALPARVLQLCPLTLRHGWLRPQCRLRGQVGNSPAEINVSHLNLNRIPSLNIFFKKNTVLRSPAPFWRLRLLPQINKKRCFGSIFIESGSSQKSQSDPSDADPDLWIRICIIKVGSGSVWRDTNPDPDPGHIW